MLLLLLFPRDFQELLGYFLLGGSSISIHDTYFLNTVDPLQPEVSDDEIPLQFSLLLLRVPFEFVFPSTHGANYVDFGGFTH